MRRPQMCRWHGARDEGGHQHALRCAGGMEHGSDEASHSETLNRTQHHSAACTRTQIACTRMHLWKDVPLESVPE
jgi:hypothetical protein